MLLGYDLHGWVILSAMPSQFFRANVGVVVVRADGLVLALERSDRPGQWQFPQGGLDEGEEPAHAALRELEEETGIPPERVELLAEYPEWLAYELPPDRRRRKTGRGQVQRWFIYRFSGDDGDIDLEQPSGGRQEFVAYRWMELQALADAVWGPKRPIYQALAEAWADSLAADR